MWLASLHKTSATMQNLQLYSEIQIFFNQTTETDKTLKEASLNYLICAGEHSKPEASDPTTARSQTVQSFPSWERTKCELQ